MSLNASRQAYEDCYEIFDRVLASTNGVNVYLPTRGQAYYLRTRLNFARVADRKAALEIYQPDDPHYGVSAYESIVCRAPRLVNGQWCLTVEKMDLRQLRIEEIPDAAATS